MEKKIKIVALLFAAVASVSLALAFSSPSSFTDVEWYYTGPGATEGWKTSQQIQSENPDKHPVCNPFPENTCLRLMAEGDDPETDVPLDELLGSFSLISN